MNIQEAPHGINLVVETPGTIYIGRFDTFNGFQVLIRTGLLPFGRLREPRATLAQNESGHFECRWVDMALEAEVPITEGLPARISAYQLIGIPRSVIARISRPARLA